MVHRKSVRLCIAVCVCVLMLCQIVEPAIDSCWSATDFHTCGYWAFFSEVVWDENEDVSVTLITSRFDIFDCHNEATSGAWCREEACGQSFSQEQASCQACPEQAQSFSQEQASCQAKVWQTECIFPADRGGKESCCFLLVQCGKPDRFWLSVLTKYSNYSSTCDQLIA